MNGSEVASMNAKSFWFPFGSVASTSRPDRYSFNPSAAATEQLAVSVHAIRRCSTGSCRTA